MRAVTRSGRLGAVPRALRGTSGGVLRRRPQNRTQRICAGDGVSRSLRNVTLTTRDIMRLHSCSRAAAGSLTLTTETCFGGNGARQRCFGVVVETAGV